MLGVFASVLFLIVPAAQATIPTGCAAGNTVCASGCDFTNINTAVAGLPNPLTQDPTCINIMDSATYTAQVNVWNHGSSTNTLVIQTDSSILPSHAVISPVATSTAAFVIRQTSVTVLGIDIVPTTKMTYGVFIASTNVIVSSMNIVDASSITTAGIVLSTFTTISYTSVTVQSSLTSAMWAQGSNNVSVSYSSAIATSATKYAFWLDQASTNTLSNDFIYNTGGVGLFLNSTSNNNSISFSTCSADGATGHGLEFTGASSNTVTNSYMRAGGSSGSAVKFDTSATTNTVTNSTMTQTNAATSTGFSALFNAVSYNTITHSFAISNGAPGIEFTASSVFNTVSYSSITGGNTSTVIINGSSQTLISFDYIFGSGATAMQILLSGSCNNTVDNSTATSGSPIVDLNASSYTTITNSFITSSVAGTTLGIKAQGNTNHNTISSTTITASGATGVGFQGVGASSNTISYSLINAGTANGANAMTLDSTSNNNYFSYSTFTAQVDNVSNSSSTFDHDYFNGTSGNAPALDFRGSAKNIIVSSSTFYSTALALGTVRFQNTASSITISSCDIHNIPSGSGGGDGVRITGTGYNNLIQYSTITSISGSPGYGVNLAASTATFDNDYIQGSTAVFVSASTNTVLSNCVLVSTQTGSAAVTVTGNSKNFSLLGSALTATHTNGGGIDLQSSTGTVTLSTNTFTGTVYGVRIATMGSGGAAYTGFSVTNLSFGPLTAGATAINFTGGLFTTTFSTLTFTQSSGININTTPLTAGTAITVNGYTGSFGGPAHAHDAASYITWVSNAVASAINALFFGGD